MSLLIAAGKHPKYIAAQAGHAPAGFSLDKYGALFETLPITPVEWWDDLIWPGGHHIGTDLDGIGREKAGEQWGGGLPEAQVPGGLQE